MERLLATDVEIGGTYITWGGTVLTVTGFRDGKFHWRDEDGEEGSTPSRALISRIRKAIK